MTFTTITSKKIITNELIFNKDNYKINTNNTTITITGFKTNDIYYIIPDTMTINEKQYTIEEIYQLPDGQRAELINEQMYLMAPPDRVHQELVGELYRVISNYIHSKNGSCKPYIAPFAVFLNADDKNYVEPDISVICDRNKLNDRGCNGAPDWMIEIVSPGSQRMDYMIKLFKYRTAGVREYWIVDKAKNRITVYNFEKDDMKEYTFTDSVKAGIYTDLEIDFSKILN